MQSMNRRKFLGVVGAGAGTAAVAAAGASSAVSLLSHTGANTLRFHAETGAPAPPWPAYVTAVVDGSVDVAAGTGTVAMRYVAGQPGSTSDIALPGLTRVVRVTKASAHGNEVRMEGVVEDRASLSQGESARVRLVLDRAARTLTTSVGGRELTLSVV